jgi:hypothetical protein
VWITIMHSYDHYTTSYPRPPKLLKNDYRWDHACEDTLLNNFRSGITPGNKENFE